MIHACCPRNAGLGPRWLLGVQVSFSDGADASNSSAGAEAAEIIDINVE